MSKVMKSKLISAARARSLKKSDQGKTRKPPKSAAVEPEEAGQYKLVSCPAGDMNFVEYDSSRYQWYKCTVCGCSFEI